MDLRSSGLHREGNKNGSKLERKEAKTILRRTFNEQILAVLSFRSLQASFNSIIFTVSVTTCNNTDHAECV